jgi:DNA repair exonuclease SbcCD ATPase subunit
MKARTLRPWWAALVAVAAGAAVAGAQSLGELAAKEQERREKERQKRGGASRVITEDQLRGAGRGTFSNPGSTAVAPSPDPSASPTAQGGEGVKPAAKEKTPDEVRAEQENAWRQRLEAARTEVTQLSERLGRLQQSLNDLSGPIYGSSRATLLSQFETAKADLAAANQKVADLEEEGRRNSYR